MTRPSTKRLERLFVEEAARHLKRAWSIGPDRETPDFIVNEGTHQFGLEVCEIFKGRKGKAGSHMKTAESHTQKVIDSLRKQYEAKHEIPLRVRFLGDMSKKNVPELVSRLEAIRFAHKPIGHQVVIDDDDGLRVFVTRSYRSGWFSVNHRVGWVARNPISRIAAAIIEKSQKLPQYTKAAGEDIRLLIYANRVANSGKLLLEDRPELELRGFKAVYFFSYPESVIEFLP